MDAHHEIDADGFEDFESPEAGAHGQGFDSESEDEVAEVGFDSEGSGGVEGFLGDEDEEVQFRVFAGRMRMEGFMDAVDQFMRLPPSFAGVGAVFEEGGDAVDDDVGVLAGFWSGAVADLANDGIDGVLGGADWAFQFDRGIDDVEAGCCRACGTGEELIVICEPSKRGVHLLQAFSGEFGADEIGDVVFGV